MATIEERAKGLINKKYSGWDFELKRWATECCVEIATEQDRISRQDEREQCIKLAQDTHCRICEYHYKCRYGLGKEQFSCNDREQIRKSMEGGK